MNPMVIKAADKFKKGSIKYNNIVCCASMAVSERINLKRVARKTLNVIYNIESKHVISFRFTNPTMTCSLYNTGSINHCGGNNMIEKVGRVRRLIERLQDKIPEINSTDMDGYDSDYENDERRDNLTQSGLCKIRIVNTMASEKTGFALDLDLLNSSYPMITSYFKQNFTGCTFTLFSEVLPNQKIRKVTATIFTTGSVNLCGCISAHEYRRYSNIINSILLNYKGVNNNNK